MADINRTVVLMNWLEEERAKLDNLTITQQAFGESGRPAEDLQFIEALSLPIDVHRQRVEILTGLLEAELAR